MKKIYVAIIMMIMRSTQLTASIPSSGDYKRDQLAQLAQQRRTLQDTLSHFAQIGAFEKSEGKEFNVIANLIIKMTEDLTGRHNGNDNSEIKKILNLKSRLVQLSDKIYGDLSICSTDFTKK